MRRARPISSGVKCSSIATRSAIISINSFARRFFSTAAISSRLLPCRFTRVIAETLRFSASRANSKAGAGVGSCRRAGEFAARSHIGGHQRLSAMDNVLVLSRVLTRRNVASHELRCHEGEEGKRGEGGIRTLGSLLDYGALAKRCFRPLSHLTKRRLPICGRAVDRQPVPLHSHSPR
jgi:hypothetical protein